MKARKITEKVHKNSSIEKEGRLIAWQKFKQLESQQRWNLT